MDTIEYNRLRRAVDVTIRAHVGKGKHISGIELTKHLRSNGFANYSPTTLHRAIRNIVRDIRQEQIPFCSLSGLGYWWPEAPDEILECINDLEDKAKDMLFTAKCLRAGMKKEFPASDQMELFTEQKESDRVDFDTRLQDNPNRTREIDIEVTYKGKGKPIFSLTEQEESEG